METKQLKRLPVGIQTFENIIEGDYLYVDKTALIYQMTKLSKYVFLSRPRRFGKSLLVSTLRSYFEGRQDLFQGLAIEQLEQDWTAYPVLHFSLASGKHMDKEQLERYLLYIIANQEQRFGLTSELTDVNLRLSQLIQTVYQQTGKQVVVLIDEYDAPLLDVVHEDTQLPVLRQVMRNFYSPLKDCDPYLRFVFLTGITKFSQLSIFSELNNLTNISMDEDFASICGITKEEMLTQMSDYIDVLSEKEQISREETISKLKQQYDGYHFTWPSPDMLNPFSLLMAFNQKKFDSFWFASGTPTYLIEMLRKFDVLPSDLQRMDAEAYDFDAPTENMKSIMPLLYQSGYITIKDYDPDFDCYTLAIPNKEVRIGLLRALVPAYIETSTLVVNNTARRMAQCLVKGDMDGALSLLQQFLLTVPYCDNASSEGHFQQVLFIVFSLLSNYIADVEVRTATGRVDMVMRTNRALYLFELKLNQSAAAALNQIDLKDYPSRFSLCELPIVKVGIQFDAEKRTIGNWQILDH
ncbi:MAG: AAA family ATPase [Parabacteroides sp.]|nr:AAA family ATPase [bacterium]MDY4101962.1 AAA family ATPase [Parabacteroides sp.]